MRAQKLWMPAGPDFGAERFLPALKLPASLHFPDFQKLEIARQVRDRTLVMRTELRHLGNFISEWFCLSFQI